jgi:hypothetical protein
VHAFTLEERQPPSSGQPTQKGGTGAVLSRSGPQRAISSSTGERTPYLANIDTA